MNIVIFESILTPGGHEHDFDRLLVTGLLSAGHNVEMVVPEGYPLKIEYDIPIHYLRGQAVSYAGVSGLKKALLAATREIRRIRWFNQLADHIQQRPIDAVIIPTATYRFLRSLRYSRLKDSNVPVIPIMHGINPQEAPNFFGQVERLQPYHAIKNVVITLGTDIVGRNFPNVHCVLPPYFPPISGIRQCSGQNDLLTLGFFGQYRREKNLDVFLDVYLQCDFTIPVKLLVQGATSRPEDDEDFQRIQRKYDYADNITFWHKALIGQEWHEAIAGVDALIMPYSAERYRYHWSAMLFTAIGAQKPVIMANTINPEVLASFRLGVAFDPNEKQGLKLAIEEFVNSWPEKQVVYRAELVRAYETFSPERFVGDVLTLI